MDASPLGDTDAPLENAAEPVLAEATAPEAVPMAVEPAPQTSASSDAPTAETEAPGAEVAVPSDAPAAISTPDDALDGTVALATEATTEQLVAAGVAGAPKGPLAGRGGRGPNVKSMPQHKGGPATCMVWFDPAHSTHDN